jgi:hypothetical protein
MVPKATIADRVLAALVASSFLEMTPRDTYALAS